MSDPAGRPTSVVDVGAEGTVGPDWQTFTAAGIGEIDGSGGEVLVTHHAAVSRDPRRCGMSESHVQRIDFPDRFDRITRPRRADARWIAGLFVRRGATTVSAKEDAIVIESPSHSPTWG